MTLLLAAALAADVVTTSDGPAVQLSEASYRAYVGDRLALSECMETSAAQSGALLDARRGVLDAVAVAREQMDADEALAVELVAEIERVGVKLDKRTREVRAMRVVLVGLAAFAGGYVVSEAVAHRR